jgi:hypothetical protein
MQYVYVFGDTNLRTPTKEDITNILMLNSQPGWVACLGSLDVIKWEEKIIVWFAWPIPKWQGYPSLNRLGADVDFQLWFWHANIGEPRTINDIYILN